MSRAYRFTENRAPMDYISGIKPMPSEGRARIWQIVLAAAASVVAVVFLFPFVAAVM